MIRSMRDIGLLRAGALLVGTIALTACGGDSGDGTDSVTTTGSTTVFGPGAESTTGTLPGSTTVDDNAVAKAADDASDAKWFALTELPELAFDHAAIVEFALKQRS